MKTLDMSPEAVTQRMKRLDELWELTVALRTSDLVNARPVEAPDKCNSPVSTSPSPEIQPSLHEAS